MRTIGLPRFPDKPSRGVRLTAVTLSTASLLWLGCEAKRQGDPPQEGPDTRAPTQIQTTKQPSSDRTPPTTQQASIGRDHSNDRQLKAKPGELWVGLRTRPHAPPSDPREITPLNVLTQQVEARGIGQWSGQSGGGTQVDVTYEVEDMESGARQLRKLIPEVLPEYDFWVSDHYDTAFDR